MQDKFTKVNGINLHYVEYEGEQPTIILMHGLTANAHAFDGLIAAGLSPRFNIISVDLRGRGLSDKTPTDYSMKAHAEDIIGLMDNLGFQKAIIGGHSFGSFLSMYIGANYPERVEKLILMDAGVEMHPNTRQMLRPSLSRLEQTYDSFEQYLQLIKKAPYLENAWTDTMQSYYRADVQTLENGKVKPHSNAENILAALEDPLTLDWRTIAKNVAQPALFVHALGAYGTADAPPLLPKELAFETVDLLQNALYIEVKGNHQTMLYHEGSTQIVQAIINFL